MDIKSKYTLNNGVEIPYLGLGTYKMAAGNETYNAVRTALDYGYRHIDTASIYGNEAEVGKAVKESGIPREDIFVTTKVWNSEQGYEKTLKAFEKSQKKLGLKYIDLYLIHWPVKEHRKKTWLALEKIYRERLVRAIGVSNYLVSHIHELMDYAEAAPTVNQVEFSPFLYQKELLSVCDANNIKIEAYTPLVRGRKKDDPRLIEISQKYGKTWAQVLIRWALQHELVVLPKSSHTDRIIENGNVFDFYIEDEDMIVLDSMNEDYRVSWDPSDVE